MQDKAKIWQKYFWKTRALLTMLINWETKKKKGTKKKKRDNIERTKTPKQDFSLKSNSYCSREKGLSFIQSWSTGALQIISIKAWSFLTDSPTGRDTCARVIREKKNHCTRTKRGGSIRKAITSWSVNSEPIKISI